MAEQSITRRLAAILAADMVGYSRLMEADEAGTIARQKAYRAEIIDPKITEHRGRIVKTTGDGVLVEFASVVDAVTCAVAMQRAMVEREADVPEERRIQYRVGVNLGDIVIDDDDIFGDGVNVAARLEGLAEPGGICIPRKVMHEVRNKLDVGYKFTGEQKVKNIETPVPVYRVLLDPEAAGRVVGEARPSRQRWQLGAVAAAAVAVIAVAVTAVWWQPWIERVDPASLERMAFPLPEKPSIAVLPFDNMSGDTAQGYLADGITESVITALSRIPKLFVISRNATFAYKGKSVPPGQVAEELGVRYILEGSLQRSGTRLRINAQLIDAVSGRHIWAEEFDRESGDIFSLQDEINEKVVTELEVKLTQGEMARLRHRQTNDSRAYELFLRGLELYWKFSKVEGQQARKLFEEVVARDPGFATAHAFLGWIALKSARLGYAKDKEAARARAQSLAEKALGIDDKTVDALTLLAELHLDRAEYATAIALYEKAVALSPNHADNLAWYGWRLSVGAVGRAAEGLPLVKKAMRLSPIYPNWYLGGLGTAHFHLGQYDEAIAAWEERRKRIPEAWLPYVYLAYGYAAAGRTEEAKSSVQALLERNPKITTRWFARVWSMDFPDKAAEQRAVDWLRKAGLPE